MFPDGWVDAIAVEGDRRTREVKRAAVDCRDYFHGVGIGDVVLGAEDFERGDLGGGVGEGRKQSG